MPRPCRGAVVYAPGHRPDLVKAALTSVAVAVILDLEDSVPPADKDAARAAVRAVLQAEGEPGRPALVVRTQTVGSGLEADLVALDGAPPPDALLVAKIRGAADLATAEQALDAAGTPAGVQLWAMIEHPAAVLGASDLAGGRLAALVLGYGDLAKTLGVAFEPSAEPLRTVAVLTLLAARAHGLLAIDGVDLAAADGLALACARAAALGFDAKTVLSAAQAELCADAFAIPPVPERRVVSDVQH